MKASVMYTRMLILILALAFSKPVLVFAGVVPLPPTNLKVDSKPSPLVTWDESETATRSWAYQDLDGHQQQQ